MENIIRRRTAWAKWFVPYLTIACIFLWWVWFRVGPPASGEGELRTVYKSWPKALVPFWLGTFGFYYAAYIIVGLIRETLTEREAKVHIALWTVIPPLWFFFEWFFWFDNHEAEGDTLRVAQDLASKLWAAVLALMVSYRLGDVVKAALSARQRADADDREARVGARVQAGN